MKKKGFTLIELLAVIIILAIVALISTPIILNVVDEARESANKSSIAMYADAVKLAVIDDYFENQSYPTIDENWIANVEYGGERVTCGAVYYTENEGVTLHECTIGGQAFNYVDDMSVSAEDTVYCYTKGKVYTDCTDETYMTYYTAVSTGASVTPDPGPTQYTDATGANAPELFDNMVAVKHDGTNWVVADTTQAWYNYANKEWANVVVLNTGITKNVGDTVNVADDVAQMYVWIPRYTYTIFNGNNGGVSAQPITISFENGTGSYDTVECTPNANGTETCTDTTNGSVTNGISTYTHPAFTLGTKELIGIWVGKFETATEDSCTAASGSIGTGCDLDNLGIQIKPNVTSWRGARVSTFYTAIKKLSTQNGMTADSHMMKNMEWGAVAYLTQSEYGRCESGVCTEISKNDSSDYYTGRSLGRPSTANGEYRASGTYTYETVNGQLASTTGNIYGVYDMSGGACEYVMGNMKNSSGDFYSSNAGFTTNPESKYYDVYKYDASSYTSHDRGKLGDATKETKSWYLDRAYFPYSSNSWFIRGASYNYSSSAGVFNFALDKGSAYTTYAVRVVLSAPID